ncbi:MAG: OmpA family protein [Rhodospirillales bacterium]|nr:OmpA family protein [Rhodospirillales bacterium]
MDAGKTVIATSLLSAVIVLGAAVPLAYYGYLHVDQRITAGQADVSRVVVELKTEALREIKLASEGAAGKTPASVQVPPTVSAALTTLSDGVTALQKDIGDLRREQQEIAELMKLRTEGLTAASMASPVSRPGAREDTLNQTIHFALGRFAGPETTGQVAALIPKIREYSASGLCKSNVLGFSDTLGGDKSNLELSLKRAEHVATLLRAAKVPVGQVQGWGERWLHIHTVDGVKNDQNRRVVVETHCVAAPNKSTDSIS